jgi:hypothetical protein
MPGYMAGVILDWEEFKKGKVILREISSSPPPVDVAKLAEEALAPDEDIKPAESDYAQKT